MQDNSQQTEPATPTPPTPEQPNPVSEQPTMNTTAPVPPAPEAVAPIAPPQDTNTQPAPASDPGHVLGIVGFIFAFIGLSLIGLFLSISGYKKSKAVGINNGLAKAGIIINSVFVGLSVLMLGLLILISMVSYGSITQRANDTAAMASATNVLKGIDAYYEANGSYPQSSSDLGTYAAGIEFSSTELVGAPSSASTVVLYSCESAGNKIGYWNGEAGEMRYIYATDTAKTADCSIVE